MEVRGAVAVNGAVAKGDPDLLLAQIERTREDLARTIDSLAERVSPANNVRMLKEKVAAQVARPEVQIGRCRRWRRAGRADDPADLGPAPPQQVVGSAPLGPGGLAAR